MGLQTGDQRELDHHAWQVRSAARLMLPMMDIGGLVDGMPEANRRTRWTTSVSARRW